MPKFKLLIRIWIFALILSACAGKPDAGAQVHAPLNVSADTIPPPGTLVEDPPPPPPLMQPDPIREIPEEWKQDFSYFNEGEPAGKWMVGNTFELLLSRENPELHIFSESMMSPHGKMKVKAIEYQGKIEVLFTAYLSGSGWDEFKPGDLLFLLWREEGKLLSQWAKLRPLYGEVEDQGEFFQPMD